MPLILNFTSAIVRLSDLTSSYSYNKEKSRLLIGSRS